MNNTTMSGLVTHNICLAGLTLCLLLFTHDPINSVAEVFDEPQVQHRQMLRQVPHPSGVTAPQLASPMRFAQAPLWIANAPPLLGQDSEAVLSELGYSPAAIQGLRDQKVI